MCEQQFEYLISQFYYQNQLDYIVQPHYLGFKFCVNESVHPFYLTPSLSLRVSLMCPIKIMITENNKILNLSHYNI